MKLTNNNFNDKNKNCLIYKKRRRKSKSHVVVGCHRGDDVVKKIRDVVTEIHDTKKLAGSIEKVELATSRRGIETIHNTTIFNSTGINPAIFRIELKC